jgi:hypothetical protein
MVHPPIDGHARRRGGMREVKRALRHMREAKRARKRRMGKWALGFTREPVPGFVCPKSADDRPMTMDDHDRPGRRWQPSRA